LPKQVIIATDIATIGVWDPELEDQDIQAGLTGQSDVAREKACEAGQLFLLHTWGDGDHVVEVYIDEAPEPELLASYSQLAGPFLVVSPSGRLSLGGAEDFRQATKMVTRPDAEISLVPGRYALTPFMVVEDKFARSIVGDEDFEYYQKRRVGFPWGCLLGVLIFLSTFVDRRITVALFAVLLLRWAYLLARRVSRMADQRYNTIRDNIDEATAKLEQFPAFLLVLRSLGDQDTLSGGWATFDDV